MNEMALKTLKRYLENYKAFKTGKHLTYYSLGKAIMIAKQKWTVWLKLKLQKA